MYLMCICVHSVEAVSFLSLENNVIFFMCLYKFQTIPQRINDKGYVTIIQLKRLYLNIVLAIR